MSNDLTYSEGFTIGYQNALKAHADGAKFKVFDWNEAAALIKNNKPKYAEAGLSGDWVETGGSIWNDNAPDMESYTYLASLWANPMLYMDGKFIECWKYYDDIAALGWDAKTKWPQSALDIINA